MVYLIWVYNPQDMYSGSHLYWAGNYKPELPKDTDEEEYTLEVWKDGVKLYTE